MGNELQVDQCLEVEVLGYHLCATWYCSSRLWVSYFGMLEF